MRDNRGCNRLCRPGFDPRLSTEKLCRTRTKKGAKYRARPWFWQSVLQALPKLPARGSRTGLGQFWQSQIDLPSQQFASHGSGRLFGFSTHAFRRLNLQQFGSHRRGRQILRVASCGRATCPCNASDHAAWGGWAASPSLSRNRPAPPKRPITKPKYRTGSNSQGELSSNPNAAATALVPVSLASLAKLVITLCMAGNKKP